ncbi:MAG: purine-nucleoside phosphorylase [Deltaproteobacteria bacterium]|nr:purine-nucleoside phosphorylase [Deltaproteobacteria bacterium]
MPEYEDQVYEAVRFLQKQIKEMPEIGIITGTGLGDIASSINITESFAYSKIPNFPVSTVESHAGRLVMGTLSGKPVLVMQGRLHLYEGYSPQEVAFPVRVMQMIGIRVLIASNAAGGLNPLFKAGDIMVIKDHINLTGSNPLAGSNRDDWGIRFPDMSLVYDIDLADIACSIGAEMGIDIKKGVYAGLKGPSLETPSENRYLQTIGADAVGFSTIMEVIAAVHAEMKILGLAVITNINNPDRPEPTTVESVLKVAGKSAPNLERIIKKVIERIDGTSFG